MEYNSENKKQAVRIQTSILNGVEKKFLVWMAGKLPGWVTSDLLTGLGIIGAFVAGLGYILSDLNIMWLWFSSFGIILNWYGDSLDGTLARVRNQQRPIYGYFLDHNVDVITLGIVCIGAGLSSLISLPIAMMTLSLYLALTIFTYINTHLRGDFKLTYAKLGPTEFRLIIIIINTIIIYWDSLREFTLPISFLNNSMTLTAFDLLASIVNVLLFIIYIVSLVKDGVAYSKADPVDKK